MQSGLRSASEQRMIKRFVIIVGLIGLVALIVWVANVAIPEMDRAHYEFEKTTQEFLQSHPRELPDLPNRDVFDSDGYTFHRDDDGTYHLWRNGEPVPARNTSDAP